MEETKFLKLLRVIEQATKAGKVRWEETPVHDTFRARLGGGAVQITSVSFANPDRESGEVRSTEGFQAWLLNERNTVADSIEAYEGQENFLLLANLHQLARRGSFHADALVDRMLETLHSAPSGK